MGKKKLLSKKELAEMAKRREEANKEILGMEFDDFKKVVVKNIDGIEDYITEMAKWNINQRDIMVDAMIKKSKAIGKDMKTVEKNFTDIGEMLSKLAHFVFLMAVNTVSHIEGKPLTDEKKKAFADCVDLDWEEMKKDYMKAAKKAKAA